MSTLRETLETYVGNGTVPAAVALVAARGRVEVQAVGGVDKPSTIAAKTQKT